MPHLNQGYSYKEQVNKKAEGHTVLSYLSTFYTHSSSELWQHRIELGEVLVGDMLALPDQVLRAGDSLIWNRAAWLEEDVPRTFELIYEDDDLLVVAKPSGLPTMPAGGFLENTLLYMVRDSFPGVNAVHRLGRATSGLVVFARHRNAAQLLSQAWADVQKTYLGLAAGLVEREVFSIRESIGLVTHARLGRVYAASPQGKPSRTDIKILEHREDTSLFEAQLITGRPHQIRIHMASIGHPLKNDPFFLKEDNAVAGNALPGDTGYFLHAHQLKLEHPLLGKELILTAEAPQILNPK